MCVACGDISTTAVTGTSFLTAVATISPLLAVWLYPLYRSFSLKQLVLRKVSDWRLATHIAVYNFSVYMVFTAMGYVAGEYAFLWDPFAGAAFAATVAFSLYALWLIVRNHKQITLALAVRLSVAQLVPFVLLSSLANLTLYLQYPWSFRWHFLFGVQTSFLTGCFIAAIFLLGVHMASQKR